MEMTRKQMAVEIELFCNTAPEYSYLVRLSEAKKGIDAFIWFRCIPNINAGVHVLSNTGNSWDVFVFKSADGPLPVGGFCRYIADGKFDKELYLNPDA